MMLAPAQAWNVLESADEVCSAAVIARAVQRIAVDVTRVLADRNPLVLCVMGGAVVFTGQLLTRLKFPLEFDYIHVTRYGNKEQGGHIEWKVEPRADVRGRTVIVLDDILDEGETLAHVKQRLLDMGAQEVVLAVFSDKDIGRAKPVKADYVGLMLPNRFVIGYGMDAYGYWRNLGSIWAIAPE